MGRLDVLRFIMEEFGTEALTALTKPQGMTPAHFAARGGHVSVLGFLCGELGNESLTVKDEDGWTPAHSAARGGHVNVLQCMIDVLGHVGFEAIASASKPTIGEIASKYGQRAVSKFVREQSEVVDEATIVPAPNVV